MERSMSSEQIKQPNRRRLWLFGAAAVLVAGGVAVDGITSRANNSRALVQWTNQQAIPTVALATLAHGDAYQTLRLPGTIQPYYKAAIYARVSGYLKSWEQDIGAHVTKGQLLASIDTPDLDQQLAQARATFASASANAQLAGVTAQRWVELAKGKWVSQQAVDDRTSAAAAQKATADAAQANLRQLEAEESFKSVTAPFDGVVTARNTDIGALINAGNSAGQELFEVSDLHKVRIYVQVPQAFVAELHPGLQASFTMPQYQGQQFDATLITSSGALDMSSRSETVELQADNPDGKFLPGTYCQVQFKLAGDPNLLRVPATALIPGDRGTQVAVLGDGNKVALTPVKLGRDLGDSVEVLAGLAPSDRVIDSPPETLQAGDQVQLAAPPPTAPPPTAPPTATSVPPPKAD
jgi:RND family efflux transporter MFP subunit